MITDEQQARDKLEALFAKRATRDPETAFIWVGSKGTDGVGYGSFRLINRESLAGRKYRLYLSDYGPAIEWLDVEFDPRLNQHRPVRSA